MKKLVLFLTIALLLATTAFADILITLDDSFWQRHQDECAYRYRRYTVNSPAGYAMLWESPTSSKQTETLPNGTELGGLWHYTDGKGETWLAAQSGERNENGDEMIRGWCRTSDCLVVPDEVAFEEAHSAEFEEWDPAYDGSFDGVGEIVLWKYPGSGEIEGELKEVPDWFRSNPGTELDICWRDPQGRMWAYLKYIFGYRNVWICLDGLDNTGLEKDESILPPQGPVYPAADKLPPPSSETGGLTIAAVAAVVAVTIFLLWMLFRKSTPKTKTEK